MNVIYDSRNDCVAEFPGCGGIQLVDKLSCRSTCLAGDMGQCFRITLASVISQDPSDESLDDFIGGYDALLTHPVLLRYGPSRPASLEYRGACSPTMAAEVSSI